LRILTGPTRSPASFAARSACNAVTVVEPSWLLWPSSSVYSQPPCVDWQRSSACTAPCSSVFSRARWNSLSAPNDIPYAIASAHVA
jgi:hypothetical protein